MGAKQSKRSVDISGKEAESAGEVAAAGAGGEGRVEQLADADSLKPQLNGDAHIHEQQTDKEKQLDSGTPENEKDATTEKESNPEEDNEAAPVTNGDSEPKLENGESSPAPEDAKKPKKEKVKKKWSLRSISFSRKDKPKQEKKQKDDEQKTNGEPEKVPEEVGDVPAEAIVNEVAQEAQALTEVKEEKTPETPVTEPITNGSSTPESAPGESPAVSPLAEAAGESPALADGPAPAVSPAPVPEPAAPEPEHLPINGLSLEEPKLDIPQVEVNVQKEPEEPTAEKTEIPPAPEISVIKEVCVEQMPLIEPTPPPLPANPPPSSVASFAATTMAPELTDASLSNTAENSVATLPNTSETKDTVAEPSLEQPMSLTDPPTVSNELLQSVQESRIENPENVVSEIVAEITNTEAIKEPILEQSIQEVEVPKIEIDINEVDVEMKEVPETMTEVPTLPEPEVTTEPIADESLDIEALPPPPPSLVEDVNDTNNGAVDDQVDTVGLVQLTLSKEIIINANHISENETLNGFEKDLVIDNVDTEQENVKNKTKDSLGNIMPTVECNGNMDDPKTTTEEITEMTLPIQCIGIADVDSGKVTSVEEQLLPPPPSVVEAPVAPEAADGPDPAPAVTPQEPVAVCDKMANLIPEVPCVPELNTETLQETTSDVAVAD